MPKYDPQNFESVMLYMRQEFGASIFRDAPRMYAIFCDLSPKLKPYGNVMRQIAERGALAELEAASGDDMRQARAMMKAQDILKNELLLGADRAEYFLNVIRILYGIATSEVPPPQQKQQPTPKQKQLPKSKPTPKQTQPSKPKPTPQQLPKPKPASQQPPPPPPVKITQRGDCGDNVTFTLDENGLLTISGNGPMWDFEWNRKAWTYNTPWWYRNKTITQAKIQRGVTTIGNHAFARCAWLKSVTIPDSVTTIGVGAFFSCARLTSVTIPDSVTTIGVGAFLDCTGLTSVMIPDSVTTIGANAFEGCAGLTSVMIPDSVTCIGNGAFARCVRLTSVMIPDSVTIIGDVTFYDCISLTSVTIPNSVTYIGKYAFQNCAALKSVSVPKNARIAEDAFSSGVKVMYRVRPVPSPLPSIGKFVKNITFFLDRTRKRW